MKKLILFSAALIITSFVFAQQIYTTPNPYPKTITVSGSAEMEIIPDEIFVNITIQEYQKKGESKKEIETIKSDFLTACKMAGLADSVVSIASYSGYNNYFGLKRNKKKQTDLSASIVYQVKFRSSALMDALVEKLDDEATKDFQIVSTSHSKMTEFRKQLKIQAIRAAKDKGIYLTEAINEKLGEAITINEPDAVSLNNFYLSNGLISNNAYNYGAGGNAEYQDENTGNKQEIDFKKMKLRYEVTVIFEVR